MNENRFWDRKFIDLDDVRLCYTCHGSGTPIVLLHGLACGQRMWFPVILSLRNNFKVITYDARGHGETRALNPSAPFSGSDFARDLDALLNHLGIEECHLVGFSFGGGAAMALAASRPSLVKSLVLADIGADSRHLIPGWLDAAKQGKQALVSALLEAVYFRDYARLHPRRFLHMKSLIETSPFEGLVKILTDVMAKRPPLREMGNVLSAIVAPTLLLRGDRDQSCMAPMKASGLMLRRRYESLVPNAAHMTPLENTAAFVSAIRNFISGLHLISPHCRAAVAETEEPAP